jgi:hypothetical protein
MSSTAVEHPVGQQVYMCVVGLRAAVCLHVVYLCAAWLIVGVRFKCWLWGFVLGCKEGALRAANG